MNQKGISFDIVQFIFFVVLASIIHSLLVLRFMGRFSQKKVKAGHYILYILVTFALSILEISLHKAPFSLVLLALRIALLWGFGAMLLKCQPAIALLTAIVAETVNLLSAGISTSITFSSFSIQTAIFQRPVLSLLLGFSGQMLTFILIIGAYQIILKKFTWQRPLPSQYLTIFFLPVLMILIVEQYIFNQVYGSEVVVENAKIIKPVVEHWQVFLIQLFACFSLFSTLYACRRLTEDFSNRIRILLLERETAAQRNYLEEARTRSEQTRSFRHDINNHLLAMSGLMERGEGEKAKEYLRKLQRVSETLSFPCKTGNTVVDTVLGSKLSLARQRGIRVECTVKIPPPDMGIIDNLDLCVLFSNAVDNAIHACSGKENQEAFIYISGREKGDFFMVEMENSCSEGAYEKGTGLTNIEAVAEKYHGAVTTEKQGNIFRLNVLLIISRHLNDI